MNKLPAQDSAAMRELSSTERQAWVTPAVTRIDAGSAENGAGGVMDDQVNFS